MYLIFLALMLQEFEGIQAISPLITGTGFFRNMLPVLLGNLIGGSVLVGFVYHVIYRRNADKA